jgi:hypothetical protein
MRTLNNDDLAAMIIILPQKFCDLTDILIVASVLHECVILARMDGHFMADPETDNRREAGDESSFSVAAPAASDAGSPVSAFSEAGSAAVAALLHLMRLMGAELVLMRPDCDPSPLEKAVRAKIDQFTPPTRNEAARQAGLAHARHLVEQVLAQIRAQAELKKSLAPPKQTNTGQGGGPLSNRLN